MVLLTVTVLVVDLWTLTVFVDCGKVIVVLAALDQTVATLGVLYAGVSHVIQS